MTDTNQKTIESYENGIDQYIQHAPNKRGGPVEDWIDKSLEGIEKDVSILELGSGYGRDAEYIEAKGFSVEKTDVAQGFVDILKQKDPQPERVEAEITRRPRCSFLTAPLWGMLGRRASSAGYFCFNGDTHSFSAAC